MTTSMREALELVDADVRHHLRSDKVATAIIRPDAIRAVRAALSSHTLDRLSDEERRVIDGARSGGMANVGYRGLQTLLAIIDRLSRQPEAEPVAWAKELADKWRGRRDTLTGDAVRDGCADELEKVAALYTSPRLDREKVADTWECAGRKQAYPEPGECDWPGCGCDPNATKVIESFLEQSWKPPLDRKAIMAALKPFAAISVYEDDDSAPVKVIVNYRISYDFTLGDFRALQSADAIMREAL